ncbi:MAG TPA: helix-turn-helix transcriptional regulator [Ktedonobacteraceae bacterium]|jgi:DNA-binding NarL/FixJ family response regulator|nr:helix-turn-helix transcriptional regulator [Ktedonobacteraceae bacterium]
MPRRRKKGYIRGKPLSEREKETVGLLALGLEYSQIARSMHVSTNTIKNHLWSIRCKTGIQSRTLLAFYAYASGIVSKDEIKGAMRWERRLNPLVRKEKEG